MPELTTTQAALDAYTSSTTFTGSASHGMRTLENAVANIASTHVPVILAGESGVGKQVFARRIHEMSARRNSSLVQVACGAISADEMVSHLSANARNAPPIGTIILDEITDLDRECQRRLLHIIPDDQNADHHGLAQERLPARIVSTSSQNLEEEVRSGRFRNDLYHRLNGVSLRIPPLRERREDIAALLDFFLKKHAVRLSKPHAALSTSAMNRALEHSWPGNVRELENLAISILTVGDEDLALGGLGKQPVTRKSSPLSVQRSLKAAARAASRSAERELILSALSRTQWNRKRAAQELQISYKSLLYKLKQIGLPNTESEQ